MKRKLVAVLLALSTISSSTVGTIGATNVWAAEEIGETEELVSGDFQYTINEDGATICIAGYTGNDVNVDIPEELDGKTVTEIGEWAFSRNANLISVNIPETVKK